MAHQAGFENVVASLGTALTPNQIGLLTRYANRIVLAYDVDAAGEKAGTLGVTALAGLIGQLQGDDSGVKLEDVRVARLPAGKDPDEVVRDDPAAWEQGVAKAKPLVEYLIGHHAARFDLKTPTGPHRLRRGGHAGHPRTSPTRFAATRRSSRSATRPGWRSASCARSWTGAIAASGGAGPGRRGGEAATRITADAVLASPDALPIGDILRAVTPVEAELLRLLLLVPDQQLRVADELGPDQLPSTLARELFRAIVLRRAPQTTTASTRRSTARPCVALDDETVARWPRRVMARTRRRTPEARAVRGRPACSTWSTDQLRERSDYNEAAQAEAERAGDTETIDRLLLERRQINETASIARSTP